MSFLETVEKFTKEVDEKSDERINHIKVMQYAVSLVMAAACSISVSTLDFNHEIVRYLFTPFLGAGVFLVCQVVGSSIIFFFTTGEIAVRRSFILKPKLQNFIALLRLVANSPDNAHTLKAIKLMSDIQEKNGFHEYSDTAKIFDSAYKRIGKTENDIEEIKIYYMREFRLLRLKLNQSERCRITSEAELIKERKALELVVEELEKERNEKIRTISDNAQSNNSTENTDLKKFKDLDE